MRWCEAIVERAVELFDFEQSHSYRARQVEFEVTSRRFLGNRVSHPLF
jgi:hypothetical protein